MPIFNFRKPRASAPAAVLLGRRFRSQLTPEVEVVSTVSFLSTQTQGNERGAFGVPQVLSVLPALTPQSAITPPHFARSLLLNSLRGTQRNTK